MRLGIMQTTIVSMSMAAAIVLAGTAPSGAQTTMPSVDEQAANSAMAEKLAQMAQTSLAGKAIGPATLRQSAALLEAACRFNPDESRFPRLLAEAYLQLGGAEGREGAIAAISAYRRVEPNDQPAQIRLIDLYYSDLETADARLKYLTDLLGSESVPVEVRSHVAVLGSKLALDRADTEQARNYLKQALDLFPLNIEALRLQYRQFDPQTPRAQRVAALLQMVRANPADPGAISELSRLLADAGLVDPSLSWLQLGLSQQQRLGQPLQLEQVTLLASELVIGDQLQAASAIVKGLLEHDPSNAEAGFLSLLIARRGGDNEKIQAAADKVRSALRMRLSAISDRLDGRATTQPAENLDVSADVKKLDQAKDEQLTNAYVDGLSDLAWLELYFRNSAADAGGYVAALQQLLPADSGTLARLEGWNYLVQGKKDEARVKLSAVADRDPLAGLGMIRIDGGGSPAEQTSQAKRILQNHASGLPGAVLIEALRDRVGLMPAAADAADIRTELDKFPREWLDFLDSKKVSSFYALKAEPLRVGHSFGEPVLVKVSITNIGNYDITVGTDGAIRPDLWFDVLVKGLAQQYFAGVAYDRLGQKLQLHPKETLAQIVRVDQDGLAQMLGSNPMMAMQLYFSLLTNPITQQAGIAPGPGGYRVQFTRVMERSPAPLDDKTLASLYQQLVTGSGGARIRAIETLSAFAGLIRQRGGEQYQGKATEIIEAIHKCVGDPVPAVRAQATYATAILADAPVREGTIRQMLSDSAVSMRIEGLMALQQAAQPARRKELARPLAQDDADPIVKKVAASVVEVADLPAATQPATQETAAP